VKAICKLLAMSTALMVGACANNPAGERSQYELSNAYAQSCQGLGGGALVACERGGVPLGGGPD
jgi:hypothetical protein